MMATRAGERTPLFAFVPLPIPASLQLMRSAAGGRDAYDALFSFVCSVAGSCFAATHVISCRWVTDSYSCSGDDCGGIGGYGTTSSAQTGGTTQLVEHDANGMAITGDIRSTEVFDFSGDAGDVSVPVDQIQPAMYTAMASADTCNFTCDPTSASCGGFSEPLGTGACSGVTITQGPAAMDTVCVGSTCIQAEPGSIELHANAAPIAASAGTQGPHLAANAGVRPTPAHFMMTAHALTFGVLSATSKLVSGGSKGWSADFKADSTDAASTITPIGGYVLKSAFAEAE